MRKFVIWMILLSVLAFAIGCTSTQPAGQTAQAPIKIGHIGNLSGVNTAWGTSEMNALKMELKAINDKGGVLGRPVELISYDFKADQLEAVNATKRLISDGVVAIIGPSASGAGIAMTAVTEPAGVPFIATVATNPKVTVSETDGKAIRTAFRACIIDPFQGKVAARYIMDELKSKTYATIYDVGSDYSQGLEEFFREAMDNGGANMTNREGFRTGEVDFRAILGKIKEQNPDVIYFPTEMTQAAMITKQARDLGITSILFTADSSSTPEFIKLAGEGSEGVFMTSIANLADPGIRAWADSYVAEYGKDPILPNPVMAVDAFRAIVYALEQAGEADSAKLITELEKIKDLQVLSGKFTMDPNTHNPLNKPCIFETIKDGAIQFVTKVENAE